MIGATELARVARSRIVPEKEELPALETLSHGVLVRLLRAAYFRPSLRDIRRAQWDEAEDLAAAASKAHVAAALAMSDAFDAFLAAGLEMQADTTAQALDARDKARDAYHRASEAEKKAHRKAKATRRKADRAYQILDQTK